MKDRAEIAALVDEVEVGGGHRGWYRGGGGGDLCLQGLRVRRGFLLRLWRLGFWGELMVCGYVTGVVGGENIWLVVHGCEEEVVGDGYSPVFIKEISAAKKRKKKNEDMRRRSNGSEINKKEKEKKKETNSSAITSESEKLKLRMKVKVKVKVKLELELERRRMAQWLRKRGFLKGKTLSSDPIFSFICPENHCVRKVHLPSRFWTLFGPVFYLFFFEVLVLNVRKPPPTFLHQISPSARFLETRNPNHMTSCPPILFHSNPTHTTVSCWLDPAMTPSLFFSHYYLLFSFVDQDHLVDVCHEVH